MIFGASIRATALALFGFAVAVAYCPYISGAAITPRWILIAVLPWLFMGWDHRPILTMRCAGALLPFAIWVGASYLWTAQPYDAIGELIQFVIAIGVVAFGASVANPAPVYLGFAAGVTIAAPLGAYAPNGDLAGQASAASAVALALTLYELRARWYWWLSVPVCLNGIVWNAFDPIHHVLTSRGAMAGLVAAAVAWAWRRSWRTALIISLIGVLIAAILIRYGFATSNAERLNIWKDTWAGVTVFGHGAGSFRYMFPRFAEHIDILHGTRPDRAHNDFLDVLFEYGFVGGALLLGGLAIVLYHARDYAESLVLVCVLGIGLTYFPFHVPSTLFLGTFALGRMCRRDSLCDLYGVGGIPLCEVVPDARLRRIKTTGLAYPKILSV